MPAVVNVVAAVPAKSYMNVLASLETRVLNVVPKPLPWLTNRLEKGACHVAMYKPPHHLQTPLTGLVSLGLIPAAEPGRMMNLRDHLTGLKKPALFQPRPLFNNVQRPSPNLICLSNDQLLLSGLKSRRLSERLISALNHLHSRGNLDDQFVFSLIRSLIKRCKRLKNTSDLLTFLLSWKKSYADSSLPYAMKKEKHWLIPLDSSLDALTRQSGRLLTPLFVKALEYYLTTLRKYLSDVKPLEWEIWVSRYPKSRRKQLTEARARVELMGLSQRLALVKNFLKIEVSTNNADPRNISPRSDEFLSIMGPMVAAIEQRLGKLPHLVKGLSLQKRDEKMSGLAGRGFQNFNNFFETDYSRFDMSVSLDYLEDVENPIFTFEVDDDLFNAAFEYALRTKGINDIGLIYDVIGTRCSGDAQTSIGNSEINHFNTWLILQYLPPGTWESLHEGDDGFIGADDAVVDAIKYNLHFMACLGFQIKAAHYRDLNQVTFCGRWMAPTESGIESICDLPRTLNKFHTICSDGDAESLLLAKCMSYYYTDRSTPMLGTLVTAIITFLRPKVTGRRLMRAFTHLRRDFWFDNKIKGMRLLEAYPYVEPSPATRALVALRCRYGVGMQLSWESYYRRFEKGIPSVIERLPGEWHFKQDAQYYAPVHEYVL